MRAPHTHLRRNPRKGTATDRVRHRWMALGACLVLGMGLVGCATGSNFLPASLPAVSGGTLVLQTLTVVDGVASRGYLNRIRTSGATLPITSCAVTSGSLPPGVNVQPGSTATPGDLSDDDSCVLIGTPTGTGNFNFSVEIRDSSLVSQIVTQNYNLTIRPGFGMTAFQVVDAVAGRTYSNSFKVQTNLQDNPDPDEIGSGERGNGPATSCQVTGLPANMSATCAPDGTGLAMDVTLTSTGVLAAGGPFNLTISVTDSDILQDGDVVVAGAAVTNSTTGTPFNVTLTVRPEFSVTSPSPLDVVDAVVGRTYNKTFNFATDLQDNGDDVPNDVNTGEAGNGPLQGGVCAVNGLPADFNSVCALDPGGLTGSITITSAGVTTAASTLALSMDLTDSPIPQSGVTVVPAVTQSVPFNLTIRNEFSITATNLVGGTSLPQGVQGSLYDFTLSVTTDTVVGPSEVGQATENGNGAITACVVGNLPAGLTPNPPVLSASGCTIQIQGTPTSAGTTTGITLTVTDSPIQQASVDVVPVGVQQQLNIDIAVAVPMVMTLVTDPVGGSFDDAATPPGVGLAPDAVSGRTYGAPQRDLLFGVTGGIPPYNWPPPTGAPAPIDCTMEGANNEFFRCNSGGAAVTGGTGNLAVSVTDAGSGGVTPQTVTTDSNGHATHTITVQPALTLTPNAAVDPPPDGVVGRTYGDPTDLTCSGGACVPLAYTAAGGLQPLVFPAVAGLPTPMACGAAANVLTCNATAAITAATGAYPFTPQVDDTTNDTTPAGVAQVGAQSVTIVPALDFEVGVGNSPASFVPTDPIPEGVEGRILAGAVTAQGVIFRPTAGTGLGTYIWDTPVAGLPGDLACFNLPNTPGANTTLFCCEDGDPVSLCATASPTPQPAAGTFNFAVTLRDPGNLSTPAGVESTDNLGHANHDIIINPPLALAISVGTITDLPEAVDGRAYADINETCVGPAACQPLVYTASGGLGDPTVDASYVFTPNGLNFLAPGAGFPDAIACATGTNPAADTFACVATAASPVNVTTGTFTPAVSVDDGGNPLTPASTVAPATTATEQRNLEVNAALALTVNPNVLAVGVNGREYGNPLVVTCSGGTCVPVTWNATGGLGDETVDGSYVFSENATGLAVPGAGFPNPIACAAGAGASNAADDFVCSTQGFGAIAVTTTGLYSPAVTVDDLANATTPSGFDSGTTFNLGRNLTINAALSFNVNVGTQVGTTVTNPDAVFGRPYADPLFFPFLCNGVPCELLEYIAAGGLGGYNFTVPASPTGAGDILCIAGFTGPDRVTCSTLGVFVVVTGSFPYNATVTDAPNSATPSDSITLNATLTSQPALAVASPSPLDSATEGSAYANMLTGAGGLASSHTWSVQGEAGLPFPLNSGDTDCDGLSMSAAGLISGTSAPTILDANCPFTADLDDAGNTVTPDSASVPGATASMAFSLPVALTGSPVISNDVLINGLEGFDYIQTFEATGGTPPFNWTGPGTPCTGPGATPSGAFPTGTTTTFTTTSDVGTLTVSPATVADTFNFGVCVNAAAGRFALKNFTVVINDATAYVTNSGAGNASVIDTTAAPPIEIATVTVGTSPLGAALTPDGTRAYVVNSAANSVSVIDTTASPPVEIATVTVGTSPLGVAITPDGTRAYVTNQNSDTVSVIDTDPLSGTFNTELTTVPVGTLPRNVAITADGTRAYVTNSSSSNVSVIDTATDTVVNTVAVGSGPVGVAISPDGSRAYVTNAASNTVSVIDTSGPAVVDTVAVGTSPRNVAFSPDGTRAYVTNRDSNNVSVIDTDPASATFNTVLTTVAVNTTPQGVAFTPDGASAYVANQGSGNVSVIDSTPAVANTVTVGASPFGVGMIPYPVLHFTVSSLPDATEDLLYTTWVGAMGGTGALTWSVVPDGANDPDCSVFDAGLDTATGIITATPDFEPPATPLVTCSFDFTVTDSHPAVPQSVTQTLTISVP